MNERKPTWNCPVCDSKALYSDLLIDGYFQEVLESKDLPEEENEIILEADGSWKAVPKEEKEKEAATTAKKVDEVVDCIDLSDDDEPNLGAEAQPPLPPTLNHMVPPPLPPMPPGEIECIDLD
jgi:hypothetical protein